VEGVGVLTVGNVSMMVDGRQETGPEESRVFLPLVPREAGSGFSVEQSVRLEAGDQEGVQRLIE
jgi:hypothetical protein